MESSKSWAARIDAHTSLDESSANATSEFAALRVAIASRSNYLLAAHSTVAVRLLRQHNKRRLNDTTTQAQHQVERGLLLDVVIRQRAAILELLTREDQTLLIRRDSLLVLDLRLHIVDGVRRLHLQGDGLTRDYEVENKVTRSVIRLARHLSSLPLSDSILIHPRNRRRSERSRARIAREIFV